MPIENSENFNILEGKTILVTGATSGIGREVAICFAGYKVNLIIIGRDTVKLKVLENELRDLQACCHFYQCDLSSIVEVKSLVQKIKVDENKIEILINNAGAIFGRYTKSVDGLEMSLALNHYGTMGLTLGLFEHLTAECRIINVSSDSHRIANLNLKDLNWESRSYKGMQAYVDSKLCNILFTYELARRTKQTKLAVNCLCPGPVASSFASNDAGWVGWAYKLFPWAMNSSQHAAQGIFKMATSTQYLHRSGLYQANLKERKSSRISYEHKLALDIWNIGLTQLGLEDPFF